MLRKFEQITLSIDVWLIFDTLSKPDPWTGHHTAEQQTTLPDLQHQHSSTLLVVLQTNS